MNKSSEKSSREKVDTSDGDKINAALTALSNNFTKYLGDIMTRSGFDVHEKELHHPTFKRFMLLTLSKSAENLYELLHSLSKTITDDEENVLKRLMTKSDKIQLQPKLDHAIQLFSSDLPRYLKNVMHSAGYLTSDTEENHDCYVSFFSSIITPLINLFIRVNAIKPDFDRSEKNKKRRFNK